MCLNIGFPKFSKSIHIFHLITEFDRFYDKLFQQINEFLDGSTYGNVYLR